MAGPGPGPGPGPSSPPPSRRRGVVEAAAAAQVLPAFEAWRIDPTPVVSLVTYIHSNRATLGLLSNIRAVLTTLPAQIPNQTHQINK